MLTFPVFPAPDLTSPLAKFNATAGWEVESRTNTQARCRTFCHRVTIQPALTLQNRVRNLLSDCQRGTPDSASNQTSKVRQNRPLAVPFDHFPFLHIIGKREKRNTRSEKTSGNTPVCHVSVSERALSGALEKQAGRSGELEGDVTEEVVDEEECDREAEKSRGEEKQKKVT